MMKDQDEETKTVMLIQRDWKAIIWRRGGEVNRVLWDSWLPDNVDKVCCHCWPGEVDDWSATPAETQKQDSQKIQTHREQPPRPWHTQVIDPLCVCKSGSQVKVNFMNELFWGLTHWYHDTGQIHVWCYVHKIVTVTLDKFWRRFKTSGMWNVS